MNRPAVLLIDHDAASRALHQERIEAVCSPAIEVVTAGTAEEALGMLYASLEQDRRIEIVIVTRALPGIPGGRLLEIVNAQFSAIGKILLSDTPNLEEAIYCFNNAGVDKYIPLPWDPEDIKFTINSLLRQREMKNLNEKLLADLHLRNEQLTNALQNLQEARDDLERSYIQTVESLAVALEAKDWYTSGHSQRVSRFATMIAKEMGLPAKEIEVVKQVALLHDIGKIGMQDTILNKPGHLTAEELELVKSHPVIGAQILSPVRTFERHVAAIRHHHEMFDGGGYPDGLRGSEIPLTARVIGLADALDAMTSTRPYRVGSSLDLAIKEIWRMRGCQFCPDVVDAFMRVLKAKGIKGSDTGDEMEPTTEALSERIERESAA